MSREVTATATNVQWVAALSILLLSIQNLVEVRGAKLLALLLWVACCGMTGVPSALLCPILLLAASLNKSKVHLIIGLLLGLCAATQLAIIIANPAGGRGLAIGIQTFLAPLMHAVYAPFMGIAEATIFSEKAKTSLSVSATLIVVAALVMAVLWYFSANRKSTTILLLALLLTGVLQSIGALGDATEKLRHLAPPIGGRYYVTACFAALIMISLLRLNPGFVAALLLIVIGNGLPHGILYWEQTSAKYPSWREQVAVCSGVCTINIWPPGWQVEIDRTERTGSE